MSITDELREWAHARFAGGFSDAMEREVDEIADRIDAEHKAKVDEAYENGKRDERADWLDETDGGYIKLPVDADGVPIRIGDTVKLGDGTFEVRRLELYDMDSWDVLDRFGEPFSPFYMHHVQPDSWERIIQDALTVGWHNGNWNEVASADIHDRLVERCRRLAGEA